MVPVLPYGFNGRWLRVDLSSKSLKIIDVPEELYKEYLGGRGIASYILFKELKPGIDPLGSENKLVFATSVIT